MQKVSISSNERAYVDLTTTCDACCKTFRFANDTDCACHMRQAGKCSNNKESHD